MYSRNNVFCSVNPPRRKQVEGKIDSLDEKKIPKWKIGHNIGDETKWKKKKNPHIFFAFSTDKPPYF